uniref:KAZALD1 protein n=1 Tax=Fopius arisanus TaxID=64838 RepID=A0A0C9PWR9_9HYME
MTYSTPFIIAFLSLSLWFCIEICADDTISNVMGLKDCGVCELYRCPDNSSRCLLGSVPDPCECCPGGRCARLEGETCWNASISSLSVTKRERGLCATNYLCQLRNDLLDEDEPEAICVCMEQSPACGSNNETYSTPCALHEEAMRLRKASLKLKHLGPCPSRPWIFSPLMDTATPLGQRVALNCEAKGFPVPDILWEFRSASDGVVLKLPNEEHGGTVHTTDGPENLMKTSWMQVSSVMRQHSGTYQCIANNTLGHASSAAFLSVMI